MEDIFNDSSVYIQRIYDSNGSTSEWKFLLFDIKSDDPKNNKNIVSKLNKSLTDKINIDLTFDIIDFVINFGNDSIISLIAKEQFLGNFLYLLKKHAHLNEELQKKLIFLLQKWALKFKTSEKFRIFWEKYENLKSLNIIFPKENYIIETYNKYISEEKINDFLDDIEQIKIKKDEYNKLYNNYLNSANTSLANPFAKKK